MKIIILLTLKLLFYYIKLRIVNTSLFPQLIYWLFYSILYE